ncbi:MAG: hypothetical protein K2N06_03500 [Oscillospiraceae bacterium]|nr:hypothetical protein [Oscillospiraceae bacterium]
MEELEKDRFQTEKAILERQRELQKLGNYQAYLDEQEREEQERVKQEFEQVLQPASTEKIVSRQNPQIAVEEENARECVRNARNRF